MSIMKFSGFWFLPLFVTWSTIIIFSSSVSLVVGSLDPDVFPGKYGDSETIVTSSSSSSNLKENGHEINSETIVGTSGGGISLDDYHPIDPTPSSKAYIKPGPIEHGTPLMPFIPRSSPPSQPPSHPENGNST